MRSFSIGCKCVCTQPVNTGNESVLLADNDQDQNADASNNQPADQDDNTSNADQNNDQNDQKINPTIKWTTTAITTKLTA